MNIIIVDDEKLSLEHLQYIIKQNESAKVVGAYNDPLKAIEQIRRVKPDVVMLDIEMPIMNGFEIAREILNIKEKNILVVFITAYNKYALKAFELEAVDYIVKPYSEDRIVKAISTINKRLMQNQNRILQTLIHEKLSNFDINKLPVWKNESIILLDLSDIFFITIEDKKTKVYSKERKYLYSDTLTELEERLTRKPFFRCYKSFIVNLQHVEKIVPMFNQSYIIKLRGIDFEIPVSRHYAKELRNLLNI